MPGFLTDITNNSILDLVFGNRLYASPLTVWFGLSTQIANKAGLISEPPTSAGYGRMGIPNKPSIWTVVNKITRSNAYAINFPAPTSAWGLVVSGFIADNQSDGGIIAYFDFAIPKNVAPPQPGPVISIGAVVIGNAS